MIKNEILMWMLSLIGIYFMFDKSLVLWFFVFVYVLIIIGEMFCCLIDVILLRKYLNCCWYNDKIREME